MKRFFQLISILTLASCAAEQDATDTTELTTSGAISAAQGTHDCWTNGAHSSTSCVTALQAATGADGTYQVTLGGFSISKQYQSVGLMLFQDDQNFIRFELWTAGSGVFANSYSVLGGVGSQKISGANVGTPTSVIIQAIKSGSTYTYKYSLDTGSTFTTAGTFTAALTVNRAGPYVDNSGTTANAVSANYSALGFPGTAAALPTGTYQLENGSNTVDGGFGVYNQTPAVQLYANNSGVDQDWSYTSDGHLANVGFAGHQMADAGNGTVSEPTSGDTWTIVSASGGYTVRNNRTGNYLDINGSTLAMGSTQTVWTAHAVGAGTCGSANGVAASAAPTANLCSAGTASAVTGSGPWNWTCGTASCSAPVATTAGFTPIANITPGAVIVHATDSTATIQSVVAACTSHVVHFAAGTYNITSSINIPSNCQVEGELDWSTIVTTSQTSPNSTVFQLDNSNNVTVTRFNFQNVGGQVISNQYGNGIHNTTIDNTHIYLNNFQHTGFLGLHQYGGAPAIWLWDPHGAVIERNACNKVLGDCIHLYSTGNGQIAKFADTTAVVRWNFASHQNYGAVANDFSDLGFGMMEVQSGVQGAMIYQNVFYSQDAYVGGAISIADGGVPCTGGTNGAFTGCLTPLYNGGQSAVVIDGNILLNNGINGPTYGNFGAIETMGTTPLFQHNFVRGLGDMSFAGYMYVYDAATHQFSEGTNEPLYFQYNTACDIDNSSTTQYLVSDQANHTPTIIGAGGNTFATTCANIAPPALPPQMVVPPELLDANGGLDALQPGNYIPGPNTYWAQANRYLNYSY